jgi:membrane-associated phospholipid phosphatase
LLGGGASDAAVCVTATAMGLTSGVARIAADRHYVSDVIAGAVLGWGVGFAMPALLHYEWRAAAPRHAWTVTPWVSSNSVGLGTLGLW